MAKAFIDSYNTSLQTISANGTIAFVNDDVKGGLCISHNNGVFSLRGPGVYDVSVSVTAVATAAGPVAIQLYNGAQAVAGAYAEGEAAAVGNPVQMNFDKLIKVLPSCCAVNNTANLTVQVGQDTSIGSCNIVIKRIA